MSTWYLTPNSYKYPDDHPEKPGLVVTTDQPHWLVLGLDHASSSSKNTPRLCKPGDTLLFMPGSYRNWRISHSWSPEDAIIQCRAVVPGSVIIEPNPVGGSQTMYWEWAGRLGFEGFVFRGDDTQTIGTENPFSVRWNDTHPGFQDLHLMDCDIDGGWDFHTNQGTSSKWGFISYGVRNMSWTGGVIQGIKKEHLLGYLHNPLGDHYFTNLRMRWAGRTALQITARRNEGPPSQGNITYYRNRIDDVCLEDGGGGSAITSKGHGGQLNVRQCKIRLGCDPELHPSVQGNITGAIVLEPNKYTEDGKTQDVAQWTQGARVLIEENDIEIGREFHGEGSARRGNVVIAHTDYVKLVRNRIVSHPGCREVLDIDTEYCKTLKIGADQEIVGDVILDGIKYHDPSYDGRGWRDALTVLRDHPKVQLVG